MRELRSLFASSLFPFSTFPFSSSVGQLKLIRLSSFIVFIFIRTSSFLLIEPWIIIFRYSFVPPAIFFYSTLVFLDFLIIHFFISLRNACTECNLVRQSLRISSERRIRERLLTLKASEQVFVYLVCRYAI